MRFILISILCFTLVNATSARNYNSVGNGRDNSRLCFRGELGLQNSIFVSAGLSFLKNNLDRPRSFAFATYVAMEANRSFYNDQFRLPYYNPGSLFVGCKGGFEISANYLLFGAEYKGHTDFGSILTHIVTPKAGLTYNGFVSIIYGHNFTINNDNYFNIGKHTISVAVNW